MKLSCSYFQKIKFLKTLQLFEILANGILSVKTQLIKKWLKDAFGNVIYLSFHIICFNSKITQETVIINQRVSLFND